MGEGTIGEPPADRHPGPAPPGPLAIAAIATPPGTGGVGIVRLSGPAATDILRQVAPSFPADARSHHLYLTRVLDSTGAVLDEVLAVEMRGPRSFTGQDVVEIHGHGGQLNMNRLLSRVLEAGATLAGPGEFTQRAFFNGRMDLTQAEAVADIIHARSELALRLAQEHLSGALGQKAAALKESLIVATTLTEAAIDFSTEEHVYQLDHGALLERLNRVSGELEELLGTYDAGRQVREGVRVVIIGEPNAGKSTLFNAFCGLERAIVTELPGTTRDYLEEWINLGGVTLRLVDTAGLRQTSDRVEHIGVDRAKELAKDADIVIWVVDGSQQHVPWSELDELHLTGDRLVLLNKADLGFELSAAEVSRLATWSEREPLKLSLDTPDLPSALSTTVAALARDRMAPASEGAVITRKRHRLAIEECLEALQRAIDAAEAGSRLTP